MSRVADRATHLAVAAFLVVIAWTLLVTLFDPLERLFPGPLTTMRTWIFEARVWTPQAIATGGTLLTSLFLAGGLAIPLAFAMLHSKAIRTAVETLFLVLQCLPLFVFTPVLVALFGWGWVTVLLPSTLVVVFPLCMSLFKAIQRVPKNYLDLFSMYGVNRWVLFWRLQFPFSLPSFFAGMRVAIGSVGTAVLAAEFAGGQEGLGMLIQESRRNFDLGMAFASIFSLALMMGVLIGFCTWIEGYVLRGREHASLA
jgi:ABC-type nitrate/sulfonate/bicarbonate transport system permease component